MGLELDEGGGGVVAPSTPQSLLQSQRRTHINSQGLSSLERAWWLGCEHEQYTPAARGHRRLSTNCFFNN